MLLLLIVVVALLLFFSVRYALRAGASVLGGGSVALRKGSAGAAPDLLTLDRLVFKWASLSERDCGRDLHSRIFDEAGNEVGVVVSEARSWLARLLDPRVGVYDRNDMKVIDIGAPMLRSGKEPIEIGDGAGRFVGSIIPKDRSRTRFALNKSAWQIMGGIEWQRSKARDVAWVAVVKDTVGRDLGRILYPKNRLTAHRLRGEESAVPLAWRGWARRFLSGSVDAYFLEFTAYCSPDMRLLMIASAAAVDIVDFRKRFTDDS